MSTILVVGGAGYIGSHVCKALSRLGYLPVTFDSLVTGHVQAVRWGPFEKGNLMDREALDRVLSVYRPGAVMHFAAFSSVGESVVDPGKFYRNNVVGSLSLLDALRDHGIRKVVFSSSCAVYGESVYIPMTEDHPLFPVNPYGYTKRVVERMLVDFGRAHGMSSVSLRYFNAAGADPDGETGENHTPVTRLIPLALAAVSNRQSPVTIMGTDYPTPDGSCIRDYIHVTDLADAHIRALESMNRSSDQGVCKVFNLSAGRGSSVFQVLEMIEKITGREVPTIRGLRRPGDPPWLVGDSTLAQQELGWTPRFSSLDTIVATGWNWLRQLERNNPVTTDFGEKKHD
ncbi:MAG: UDP-glucose 4-epimerase GalE [Magnetococcales bacterium]|nr:UDP-glucose 4-epimerase GalE [Magnetococcales bacterium]